MIMLLGAPRFFIDLLYSRLSPVNIINERIPRNKDLDESHLLCSTTCALFIQLSKVRTTSI
jgi:hypothetical protein